jgi:hypothetical protein
MIYANLQVPEVIMFQNMKDPESLLSVRRVTSLEDAFIVSLGTPLLCFLRGLLVTPASVPQSRTSSR